MQIDYPDTLKNLCWKFQWFVKFFYATTNNIIINMVSTPLLFLRLVPFIFNIIARFTDIKGIFHLPCYFNAKYD